MDRGKGRVGKENGDRPLTIFGLKVTLAFTITGRGRFVFFFNISVCPVWWTKLTICQLFTAR